jgi:hypothetical protein
LKASQAKNALPPDYPEALKLAVSTLVERAVRTLRPKDSQRPSKIEPLTNLSEREARQMSFVQVNLIEAFRPTEAGDRYRSLLVLGRYRRRS